MFPLNQPRYREKKGKITEYTETKKGGISDHQGNPEIGGCRTRFIASSKKMSGKRIICTASHVTSNMESLE